MPLKLFWLFFKINLFSPSGPASYGLTEKLTVPTLITQEKFAWIAALAAGIPGSDAIQMAWFIGYEVGKFAGAIAAVIGALTPCLLLASLVMLSFKIISSSVTTKFMNGVKPVVILLLITTALSLIGPYKQFIAPRTLLTLIGAGVLFYFQFPITLILVISGLAAFL